MGGDPEYVEAPLSDLKEARLWPEAPPFVRPRHLVLDIAAAQEDLGYQPTPFPTWIVDTARWFLEEYPGPDSMGYGGRHREIQFAKSRQHSGRDPLSEQAG